MTKEKFLSKFEKALLAKGIVRGSAIEIVEDYSNIIDESLERGKSLDAVINGFGPIDELVLQFETEFNSKRTKVSNIESTIEEEIRDKIEEGIGNIESKHDMKRKDYHKNSNARWRYKLVALSPFISLALTIYFGAAYDMWSSSWMFLLLIPVSSILLVGPNSLSIKLVALSPFISTVIFMILGLYFDRWLTAWLWFLLIPMLSIILKGPDKFGTKAVALSPFISFLVFYLLGLYNDMWYLSWLAFLMVPLAAILLTGEAFKEVLFGAIIIASAMFVLALNLVNGFNIITFIPLMFVPAAKLALYSLRDKNNLELKKNVRGFIVGIVSILLLAVCSYGLIVVESDATIIYFDIFVVSLVPTVAIIAEYIVSYITNRLA